MQILAVSRKIGCEIRRTSGPWSACACFQPVTRSFGGRSRLDKSWSRCCTTGTRGRNATGLLAAESSFAIMREIPQIAMDAPVCRNDCLSARTRIAQSANKRGWHAIQSTLTGIWYLKLLKPAINASDISRAHPPSFPAGYWPTYAEPTGRRASPFQRLITSSSLFPFLSPEKGVRGGLLHPRGYLLFIELVHGF